MRKAVLIFAMFIQASDTVGEGRGARRWRFDAFGAGGARVRTMDAVKLKLLIYLSWSSIWIMFPVQFPAANSISVITPGWRS